MDYLRTINLGYGVGEPGKQACWMSALSAHLGGEWTDKLECVDPTINELCIWINDQYGSGPEANRARTEDILAFGLFEPIGTKGTPEQTERRLYYCLDRAARWLLPAVCRTYGMEPEAAGLEKLAPITDRESARGACTVVDALVALAALVALVARTARRSVLQQYAYPLLRELIDLGPKAPVETVPVCGVNTFLELVGARTADHKRRHLSI